MNPPPAHLCRPGTHPYGKALALKLPPGDAGTDATIAAMIGLIEASDATRHVAELALIIRDEARAIAAAPRADGRIATLAAIYEFLRRSVRFKADPAGTELTRHPDQLIAEIAEHGHAAADCDDVATLGAALVRQAGMLPLLIVVGRRSGQPYEHVFFGALLNNVAYPLDPQEGTPPGAWPSPRPARCKVYRVPPLGAKP